MSQPKGTLDQQSVHPPAQAVHHEARNVKNSAAYMLPKLLSMKEDNPQLTLLDVGAGSGTITIDFAKLIPDGHVTGIDVNPNILPRARAVAEMADLKNVEFREGSAYKLPFADATFDITCCHQMLVHLPTPLDALSEMIRVTKPGGIIAAREGDFQTECVWPDLSILSKFHNFIAGAMSSRGGTPNAGRQLVSWALKCGVKRSQITLSFSPWFYQTPSERQTWGESSISIVSI